MTAVPAVPGAVDDSQSSRGTCGGQYYLGGLGKVNSSLLDGRWEIGNVAEPVLIRGNSLRTSAIDGDKGRYKILMQRGGN